MSQDILCRKKILSACQRSLQLNEKYILYHNNLKQFNEITQNRSYKLLDKNKTILNIVR